MVFSFFSNSRNKDEKEESSIKDNIISKENTSIPHTSGCPVKHNNNNKSIQDIQCPIDRKNPSINPMNFVEYPDQSIAENQKIPLSTERIQSTIPKGDFTPKHQPNESDKEKQNQSTWLYPSEQQYFNAMKRKGWNPKERDIRTVVAIHNTVNEKGWKEVLEWEYVNHGKEGLESKLYRFMGRPNDISPKAFIKTYLLFYKKPFDRHDWIIERKNGEKVRYILDFYSGQINDKKPLAVFVDVRPALDSFKSLKERLYMNYIDFRKRIYDK